MNGWRRWFFTDGRLRTLWRALLFMASFFAILQLLLLLVPLPDGPLPEDRVSIGLVVQSALLLAAAVLAGWAVLHWVEERPIALLGFPLDRRVAPELAVGLLVGAGAVATVVLLLALAGGYRYGPEPGSIAGWMAVAGVSLAALALPAVAEEALFRGYLFRALAEGSGAFVAVMVTSVLFAWAHGANPEVSLLALLNIFLAGVLLAVAVLRTRSLWYATTLHLGWNWVMAGPLDLPVSGLSGYDVPLYDTAPAGPSWLSGGAFGPEGGLAGTAAVLLALGLTLWTTRPGGVLAPPAERTDYG